MVRIASVLSSWKTIREDTAQAVADFSNHDLSFKPTAGVMSFGEIASHILEASHARLLLEGVENLATPQVREMIGKHIGQLPKTDSAATLAQELRIQLDQRAAELTAQPAVRMQGIVPPTRRRRVAKANA